ncbi:MAG: CotH kinase family protein [Verrucomicrobia bacterium]|nr:CotH kinase family protein [Verrucomicrobiota bacterium]
MIRRNTRKLRALGGITAFLWLKFAALLWVYAFELARISPADDVAPEVFGLAVVHHLHLEMSPAEYEAMDPSSPKGAGRDFHRSGGTEFPWAHAIVTVNGRAYKNVAVRYKGHFTYGATQHLLKRSMKIALEHFGGNHRFGPLKTITLNAGILDPHRMREALAYAAYRDAGVPAPRTAFAEVVLSVPGRYDHELLGLFTLIEDVDKPFLKDRFGDSQGLLMKPEGVRGPEYQGENWAAYRPRYLPNREATPEEAKLLMALARLIERADTAEFKRSIGDYLDLDKFLRYLAVTAMTVNLDSPLAMGQNFFMYLPAKTNKVVFLPWDLDLTFAAWPFGGSAEQQMNFSLLHPHQGQHRLIERLLADKEIRARYLGIIKELAVASFSEAELLARIGIVEKAIKEPLAREAKALAARHEAGATRQAGQIAAGAPSLRDFAVKRLASIQAQLKTLNSN